MTFELQSPEVERPSVSRLSSYNYNKDRLVELSLRNSFSCADKRFAALQNALKPFYLQGCFQVAGQVSVYYGETLFDMGAEWGSMRNMPIKALTLLSDKGGVVKIRDESHGSGSYICFSEEPGLGDSRRGLAYAGDVALFWQKPEKYNQHKKDFMTVLRILDLT